MSAPIHSVIVDDEPAARGALRSLLAEADDIEVIAEFGDGRAALDFIRTENPQLLFLDVQMPEMDGFTMLRQLDPAPIPVTIFVTAYDQYALRAFDAEAVDYLLKPFSDERFHRAVERARKQLQLGQTADLSREIRRLLQRTMPSTGSGDYLTRLTIKHDGRVTVLPLKDVDWLEADGDFVKVHAGRTQLQFRETMKQLETQLDPARFVRIHRSIIVCIDRIRELQAFFRGDYVVILENGARLRLSRRFKDRLVTLLGRPF